MNIVDYSWQSVLLDYPRNYLNSDIDSSFVENQQYNQVVDNFDANYIMDGTPFDDSIFSDFGSGVGVGVGTRSATGVHSIQVMLGLHGNHHPADLIPPRLIMCIFVVLIDLDCHNYHHDTDDIDIVYIVHYHYHHDFVE